MPVTDVETDQSVLRKHLQRRLLGKIFLQSKARAIRGRLISLFGSEENAVTGAGAAGSKADREEEGSRARGMYKDIPTPYSPEVTNPPQRPWNQEVIKSLNLLNYSQPPFL